MIVLEAVDYFLKFIDGESIPQMDSADLHFSKLLAVPTYDPVTAYLATSENLSLISDQQLKRRLSTWNSDYTQLLEAEFTWKDFRDNHFFNYLIPRYPLRNMYNFFWRDLSIKRGLLQDPDTDFSIVLERSKRQKGISLIWDDEDFEHYLSHVFTLNRLASFQIDALEK